MRKQSKVYKSSLPKEVIIPPAAEVEALERRLRLAASAYYEESPAQKPRETTWLFNKPPGIIRRFQEFSRVLLPTGKYKKRVP
ncbi:MAG: hypothetical protein AAB794_02000 [Patescibacteria group bacterium]